MAERTQKRFALNARAPRSRRGWFGVGGPGPITALDLDGPVLRAVQSVRRGQRTEITASSATNLEHPIGLPNSDPAADGKCLAEALSRLKIKPGSVIMAVPRGLVFLRTLVLPFAGTQDELAAMVHFQIGKDLPFPPEEAVLDFKLLRQLAPSDSRESASLKAAQSGNERSEAAAKMEVLVAAVKKEIVEQYRLTAAAAGLKLTSLGLRTSANARCVGVRQTSNGEHAVALLSLRPDEVNIDVVVDQESVFSRAASITPAEAGPDAAAAGAETNPAPDDSPAARTPSPAPVGSGFIQVITTELVRSLHSYEGTPGYRPVEKILIVGGPGNDQALAGALAQRFRIPCEPFRPAVALGLNAVEVEKRADAPAAYGLALGAHDPEGLPFDFLHPKQPPLPRNWRRIKILAGASGCAIVIVALAGMRSHWIGKRLLLKEHIQVQLTQAEKNRPIFRDMRLKAKTVRDWVSEKRNWLDHYAYLSALLPPSPEVYLTSLSTGVRGTIHLGVQARSGESLAQMDKRLREAGYEVKPLAITPGTDKHGYPFRTSVELTLPEKMKVDSSALKAPARPEDDESLEPPADRAMPEAVPPATPAEGLNSKPRKAPRSKS